MKIKVILLDIDGTLTNKKKEITPKTREALLKVQEHGVRLALSSGRPDMGLYKWARELDMINHNGLFICFNGGKVINCQNGEVLFNQPIPIEDAKAVLNHMKNFNVVSMINKGEYMYVTDVFNHDINIPNDPRYTSPFNIMRHEARGNGYMLCEKRDLAEFVDFDLNKILNFADPEYLQSHYKEMAKPFEGKLNSMFTAPFYYEFTANGVDKAKAIEAALLPQGYKREEMMAFGDMTNDFSMLKYAGIGVAMGNAIQEIKDIADEVTASNEEDGIALSLYKHFPEIFNN